MLDNIFGGIGETVSVSVLNLSLTIIAALAMGLAVSFVYIKTNRDISQSFPITLVILPAVTAVIILLIGNSVAKAFSLAGAFQIIRFRSAPGNPKDMTYVLLSMAIGLCCGMGYLLYGVIATLLLCLTMVVLETVKFGGSSQVMQLLKITVPENMNYNDSFDSILAQHTSFYKRVRVKTVDMGSLYEVQYNVCIKSDTDEKMFIDELRCRNGNLNITLILEPTQNGF
ncbi:DUF4956 domain-containing protein [Clostridia bacterium]|nr:DUF4956 domain-containing protein [Clostridia bacterium]